MWKNAVKIWRKQLHVRIQDKKKNSEKEIYLETRMNHVSNKGESGVRFQLFLFKGANKFLQPRGSSVRTTREINISTTTWRIFPFVDGLASF